MKIIYFFKKHKILAFCLVCALIILGLIAYYYNIGKKPSYNSVIAKKIDIIQEVSATGKIKPAQNIELAFEKSGKIIKINTSVGNKVFAGQALAELDSSELNAQLLQDKASLDYQEAKLNELKSGTRPEEIKIAQANLDKSNQDLANIYSGVFNVLADAYASADDAVRSKSDALFSNDETINPAITFQISNNQLEIDFKYLRFLASNHLNAWKNELPDLNGKSSYDQLDLAIENSEEHIAVIRDFLDKGINAMNYTVNLSLATLDSYKTNLNTARNNINGANENINNRKQSILVQKSVVRQNQDELNLKLAGATPQSIEAQAALVAQARAKIESTNVQIDKNILKAPINGIVIKQDFKIGQIVASNVALISVVSENDFEIEANIAEADIAKVKIGDSASITLDAYGNDVVFKAKIAAIDPAETIIEGVATYKTTLYFLNADKRIKSGMTANIDILTNKKNGVIGIPQRAVITRDKNKIVRILTNGVVNEVNVKTGLVGSDGNIEIIEGVKEGDEIIISSE